MQKKPLFKLARQLFFHTRPTKKLTAKQSLTLKHLILWKFTKSKTNRHLHTSPSDILKLLRLWQRYNPIPKAASIQIRRVQKNEEKESDFFGRFIMRQTLSQIYGSIRTNKLTAILQKAKKRKGHAGQNFLALLESRVDIVLYRIGFCTSIHSARQLIGHKKIHLNGNPITNSGVLLMPGDIISVIPQSHEGVRSEMVNVAQTPARRPVHIEVNYNILTAIFLYEPTHIYLPSPIERDDIIRSF